MVAPWFPRQMVQASRRGTHKLWFIERATSKLVTLTWSTRYKNTIDINEFLALNFPRDDFSSMQQGRRFVLNIWRFRLLHRFAHYSRCTWDVVCPLIGSRSEDTCTRTIWCTVVQVWCQMYVGGGSNGHRGDWIRDVIYAEYHHMLPRSARRMFCFNILRFQAVVHPMTVMLYLSILDAYAIRRTPVSGGAISHRQRLWFVTLSKWGATMRWGGAGENWGYNTP